VTDTAPPAAVQIARDAMRPRFGYITSEEVRPALDALAHAGWLRPPHPKHPELPEPTETERMGWDMAQRRVGERDAALAEVERLRHHLAWAADRLRVAGLAIDAKVLTDIAALDAAPGRTTGDRLHFTECSLPDDDHEVPCAEAGTTAEWGAAKRAAAAGDRGGG
jgi:hypothetical protein